MPGSTRRGGNRAVAVGHVIKGDTDLKDPQMFGDGYCDMSAPR